MRTKVKVVQRSIKLMLVSMLATFLFSGNAMAYSELELMEEIVSQFEVEADQITCHSGGSCSRQDVNGNWVTCFCGGGVTCDADETCVCRCQWVDGNSELTCGYGCSGKPKMTLAHELLVN